MIEHNERTTLTVPFAQAGCVLHRIHLPRPVQTHRHHKFPKFLQLRKWGEVRDRRIINVCPTGHSDVHHAINVMLGSEPKMLPGVGRKERALAAEAVALFNA